MRNFYFFILIFITSCGNNIHHIIKHQDEIIAISRNKEIINDKERNFYTLMTFSHCNEMQNEYFFNRQEKGKIFYTLLRDSIQFNPDTIINVSKEQDKYKEDICNYYQKISQVLDSYGIKSLSGERYKNSPKVTIHMGKEILIYQPNSKALKDKDFANFKKISDGWYILK